MIDFEHVIARQRAESANIALTTIANRGESHAAMRSQGLPVTQTPESYEEDGEVVRFSGLGDELDFVLS